MLPPAASQLLLDQLPPLRRLTRRPSHSSHPPLLPACAAVPLASLPLPTASWHHAAFHTVTAVVGAGVLGLPHSFSFLGW